MRARLMIAAAVMTATTGLTAPVFAQTRGTVITIFGNDKCPTSSGEQTNICVRAPESERYRIPQTLRETIDPEPAATKRLETMRVTDNGTIGTGSTSGPGGMIGNHRQEFAKARAENKAKKATVPVID